MSESGDHDCSQPWDFTQKKAQSCNEFPAFVQLLPFSTPFDVSIPGMFLMLSEAFYASVLALGLPAPMHAILESSRGGILVMG